MNIPATIPTRRVSPAEGGRPPLIDEHNVMRIDNSSLEHFTSCARMAEYYLLDRRQPVKEQIALRFGGAFHIALEIFYRDFGGRVANLHEYLAACRDVLEPYFESYPPPPDDHRTLKFLEECLITYVSFAELTDDFRVINIKDEPAIELYFEIPLGVVDFQSKYNDRHVDVVRVLWTGRIDAIIKRHGIYRIMDHKTTSMLGANFFAEFMNSSPTMGYTWAAKQLTDLPIAGLYLNALAVRKPSRSGVQFEVQRQSFDYDDERLNEWQFNTLTLVSDFLSHLDRGYFPQEYRWCVGKYGPCKYLEVCTMPPATRAMILQGTTFEDVTWNPKHGTRQ